MDEDVELKIPQSFECTMYQDTEPRVQELLVDRWVLLHLKTGLFWVKKLDRQRKLNTESKK